MNDLPSSIVLWIFEQDLLKYLGATTSMAFMWKIVRGMMRDSKERIARKVFWDIFFRN